jgi:hypothetical protein
VTQSTRERERERESVGSLEARVEPKTPLTEIVALRDGETRVQIYDVHENDLAFELDLKVA